MKLHPFWLASCALFLAQCAPTPTLDEPRAAVVDAIVAEVSQDKLISTVEALVEAHETDAPVNCFALQFPYDPYCHLTREKARALVRQRFEAVGLSVTDHLVKDGASSTVNVIGEKKGTKHPDEIVMVGAHYDAFYSGADDNSSGVAAVLEIARVLQNREFSRTIRFIGFDLEEFQLVGSTRYATSVAQDNIVGAIVFDCIGFRRTTPNSQNSIPGFPAPSAGDFIAVIGNDTSSHLSDDAWLMQQRLGVVKVVGVGSPGSSEALAVFNLMRSDHAPFWLQGQPALFMTDTANFRNENYHTPSDELSTLDTEFLKGVTQLSAALIAYWAGGGA